MAKKVLIIVPVALVVLAAAAYGYINYKVRSQVDDRLATLVTAGDYSSLEYESLTLELSGDITMQNLHVVDAAGNEYVLTDIRVTELDYNNEVPYHLALNANGIRFPAGIPEFGDSPNTALNNYLASVMDEDFLPLEFNYRYNYAPEEGLRLDSGFSINLPDSFLLSTESEMRNVPLQQLENNTLAPGPDAYSMLMQNADVPSASMTLQDLGLVDAMMAIQGEEYGINAEQYRQQMQSQLQAAAMFAPQPMQVLAMEYVTRFIDFLEGSKTMRIAITPEYGGNIQQLQGEIMSAFFIGDFQRIVELLHLEIETR